MNTLQNDKTKLLVLMVLAMLGDLLWLFYWVPHWWSDAMSKWQGGLHNIVILCVVALLVLKVVITLFIAVLDRKEMNNNVRSNSGRNAPL
jgi:heme/copper-type cytochrome/quinol oxidase subunit 2